MKEILMVPLEMVTLRDITQLARDGYDARFGRRILLATREIPCKKA